MENINLGDSDAWDDSALLDTWNGALNEYKKYHSLHVKGEDVEAVLDRYEAAQQNNKDLQTTQTTVKENVTVTEEMPDAVSGRTEESLEQSESDAVPSVDQTRPADHLNPTQTQNACDNFPRESLAASAAPAAVPIVATEAQGVPSSLQVPQGLIGNVQDEALKNLMMSWYYAGYYTGFYEGRTSRGSD